MRSAHSLAASSLVVLLCACASPAPAPSADPIPAGQPATSAPEQPAAAIESEQAQVAETHRAEPERHVRLPALSDLNGTEHDLPAALARGETVALLVWWPTPSCEALAARVSAAAAEHGHAIRFLGIVPAPRDGLGYDNLVRGTAADWELDLPSVLDPGADLAQRLQGGPVEVPDAWEFTGDTQRVPWVSVLGAEGRVLWSAANTPPAWDAFYGQPRAGRAEEPGPQNLGAGATR